MMNKILIWVSVLLLKHILSSDSISYMLHIVRSLDKTELSDVQKRLEALRIIKTQSHDEHGYKELTIKDALLNLALEVVVNYARMYPVKNNINAP